MPILRAQRGTVYACVNRCIERVACGILFVSSIAAWLPRSPSVDRRGPFGPTTENSPRAWHLAECRSAATFRGGRTVSQAESAAYQSLVAGIRRRGVQARSHPREACWSGKRAAEDQESRGASETDRGLLVRRPNSTQLQIASWSGAAAGYPGDGRAGEAPVTCRTWPSERVADGETPRGTSTERGGSCLFATRQLNTRALRAPVEARLTHPAGAFCCSLRRCRVVVMTEDWLSLSQAANRLGLSAQAVRNMADAGRVECYRSPLGRLVAAKDVERLAHERAQRSGAPAAK
jgi:hypothetical protein